MFGKVTMEIREQIECSEQALEAIRRGERLFRGTCSADLVDVTEKHRAVEERRLLFNRNLLQAYEALNGRSL